MRKRGFVHTLAVSCGQNKRRQSRSDKKKKKNDDQALVPDPVAFCPGCFFSRLLCARACTKNKGEKDE